MRSIIALFNHPHVRLIFRLVLGGVFVYASLAKVQDPAGFARSVSYYHLLPPESLNLFALVLPWLELIAGAALILGVAPRGSALALGVMLVMFVIALSWAVVKGIDISCGCFSAEPGEGHKVGLDLIYRDLVMIVMAIPIIVSGAGTLALERLFGRDGSRERSSA